MSDAEGMDDEAVQALLADARAAAAQQQWRAAAAACARALTLQPNNRAASLALSAALQAAGKPASAVQVLQAAIKQAEGRAADADLLKQLGLCQLAAGLSQQALQSFRACLELFQDQGQQVDKGHLHQQQEWELQALCAAALYQQPAAAAKEAALQLTTQVLQESQQTQPDALALYAQMLADEQAWAGVAQLAVRLLTVRPGDRRLRQLLARAVQEPAGMQQLLSDVGRPSSRPAATAAAAQAFLARMLQSQGAVKEATQLCRCAVQLQPCSSSHALLLASALELQYDYAGVLQVLLQHCAANRAVHLGGLCLQAVLELPLLQELSRTSYAPGSRAWLQPQAPACWQPASTVQAAAGSEEPTHAEAGLAQQQQQQQYSQDQLNLLGLLFTAAKVCFCGGALAAAQQLLRLCDGPASASAVALHTTSIRNEAAFASLIRLLLRSGDPAALSVPAQAAGDRLEKQQQQQQQPSAARCDPAAAQPSAAQQPDKAASINTIGSALAVEPCAPSSSTGSGRATAPLYLLGDSHCLSGAWQLLSVGGRPHLLQPLLVTGVKLWHLRPGQHQRHYTACQFAAAVAALPPGSWVVLLLGDLDCREGLTAAVEKLKYDSLDEAVAATAAVYSSLLQELVVGRQLRVCVHPLPQLLPESRHIVQLFEGAVAQQVQQFCLAHPEAARGRVFYLGSSSGGGRSSEEQQALGEQQEQTERHRKDSAAAAAGESTVLDGIHWHPQPFVWQLAAAIESAASHLLADSPMPPGVTS